MVKKESVRIVDAVENCLSNNSIGPGEYKNIDNILENQSVQQNSWLAGYYANIDFTRLNQGSRWD